MKKLLITGINGFVGTTLVKALAGRYDISGIDRDNSAGKALAIDILDQVKVAEAIYSIKPDYIIHLAAQASVSRSWENPAETMAINVDGTRNLFEAVIQAGIHPTVLVTSSAEVYGIPKYTPIDEKHPVSPQSPYAESKRGQENVCKEYFQMGIAVVISRSFPHTGPGQKPGFVCPDFAKQIADIETGLQEPVIKVGNLSAIRDFCDVQDIVRAYELCLLRGKAGETYNICSGKGQAISEILEMMLSLSSAKIIVEQEESRIKKNDIPVLVGSHAKFSSDTGWQPEIPFERTVSQLLSYWRLNSSGQAHSQ